MVLAEESEGRITSCFVREGTKQASERQIHKMITEDWGCKVLVIDEISLPSDADASAVEWDVVLNALADLDEVMKPQPSYVLAYMYLQGFMAGKTGKTNRNVQVVGDDPIESLPQLPKSIVKRLKTLGITTIAELCAAREEELLTHRTQRRHLIGKSSLQTLKQSLSCRGLSLKTDT
jgi:hypothetical protein